MKCKKFLLTLTPFCFVGPLVLSSCGEKYINIHEFIAKTETLQILANNSFGKVNITYNDLYMATSSLNKTYLVIQFTYSAGIPEWDRPVDDNDYVLDNYYRFSSIGSSMIPIIYINTGPWNNIIDSNQDFRFDLYGVIDQDEWPTRRQFYSKTLDREITKKYNGVDYLDFVITPKPTSYYYFFEYPYRWLEQSLEFSNIFSQSLNKKVKWGSPNACHLLSVKNDIYPIITSLSLNWLTSDVNTNMKKLEVNF